jgi:hypothetical protein
MSAPPAAAQTIPVDPRTKALEAYRKKLLEHREFEAKVKESINILIKFVLDFVHWKRILTNQRTTSRRYKVLARLSVKS